MERRPGGLQPGDRIVVRTPDRRAYYGRLLDVRAAAGNDQAVVRLDTGWITAYPLRMVHRADDGSQEPPPGRD